MKGTKALRQQVISELRVQRYVLNTALFMGLCYLLGTLCFGDMGLLRYLDLKDRRASIENELNVIMDQNTRAKMKLASANSDSYYLEKNARESFGMSSPDEYVFIFKQ